MISVEQALAQLCAQIESRVNLSADGRAELEIWMNDETNGAGELHCEVLATPEGQRMWPQLIRRLKKMDLAAIQGDADAFGEDEVRKLEKRMQSGTIFCEGTDGG